LAEGVIDVSNLVTGRVGLDGVAQAFRDLGDPEAHVKVLVEPAR
jgi:threonine dehydrogenase-like Zn-dependent dehydrogenase